MPRLLKERERLRKTVAIFNSPNAKEEDLKSAGEKVLIALYNGRCETFDSLRFQLYNKMARMAGNKPALRWNLFPDLCSDEDVLIGNT